MGFELIAFSLAELSGWLVIIQVALGLGAVIFIHELGHFLVAKACGVKCEKFYLGFDIGGLKLAKFQWGETEYGIGILPLGGYVKMLGQDDNPNRIQSESERARANNDGSGKSDAPPTQSDLQVSGASSVDTAIAGQPVYDPRSYMAKSVPQRMAIISAGVIMNVIFAFVVGAIGYSIGVSYTPATVGRTVAGDPAWIAGLSAGDEIVRIGDLNDPRYRDLITRVSAANLSKGVELEVARPGVDERMVFNITPSKAAVKVRPTIGVQPGATLEVFEVVAGSEAEKAGLKAGDVITAVDGQPITTAAQWDAILANRADQPLQVTVKRKNGDTKPGEDPSADKADASAKPGDVQEVTLTLPPQPKATLGIVMTPGPISAVQNDSPAAEAGIEPGDRLLTIDGEPIGDPLTLDARLRARPGQDVELMLKRPGADAPVTVNVRLRSELPGSAIVRSGGPIEIAALGVAMLVEPRVADVVPGSPAARAGVQVGAEVRLAKIEWPSEEAREKQRFIPSTTSFNPDDPSAFASWPWFEELLGLLAPKTSVRLTFADGSERVMNPTSSETAFTTDRGILMAVESRERVAASMGEAIAYGWAETKDSLLQVYWFIQKLVSGQISWRLIGGPGTIAAGAGATASQGFGEYLLFLTLISANLAVVNFLPIPLLDGGHMLFLAIEGIRGKPVSERVVVALTYLGLAFILGLMLLGIGLDSLRGLRWFGIVE